MPTPVYINGFESGVVETGAAPTPNDRIWHTIVTTGGVPGIDTTTPRSGARCLDIPATSGAASYVGWTLASPTVAVKTFGIRFVGSLPDADCLLVAFTAAAGAFGTLKFVAADSKLYAALGSAAGASGFSVVADTWYLVDMKTDVSTGTRTCDVSVNGTAVGQASAAVAASTIPAFRMGKNVVTTTANGNIRYDDLVVSVTGADYPMGDHEVLKMSPNADGTHSFTANDFLRGDAGAAILTSDTDVNTLVDDVPFAAIGTTDSIQQAVNNAAGYVELGFEASPRTANAWGIQVHHQYDSTTTGAHTVSSKLNDGGTLQNLHLDADVSQTSVVYLSEQAATAPTGGPWTQAKLDALLLRFGFAGAIPGAPILHALMIEAAFPVAGGTTTGVGSAAATSTATATSVSTARAPGTGAGTTTAAGVGAATARASGLAAPTSTATGVGAATARASGAATVTSTAEAVSDTGAAVAPAGGSATYPVTRADTDLSGVYRKVQVGAPRYPGSRQEFVDGEWRDLDTGIEEIGGPPKREVPFEPPQPWTPETDAEEPEPAEVVSGQAGLGVSVPTPRVRPPHPQRPARVRTPAHPDDDAVAALLFIIGATWI